MHTYGRVLWQSEHLTGHLVAIYNVELSCNPQLTLKPYSQWVHSQIIGLKN